MTNRTAREVVDERDGLYGGAWALHGKILKPLRTSLGTLATKYPVLLFPWHMIFNKLLRILASPTKRDHWLDIQGYAQLVIDEIDKEQHKKDLEDEFNA